MNFRQFVFERREKVKESQILIKDKLLDSGREHFEMNIS